MHRSPRVQQRQMDESRQRFLWASKILWVTQWAKAFCNYSKWGTFVGDSCAMRHLLWQRQPFMAFSYCAAQEWVNSRWIVLCNRTARQWVTPGTWTILLPASLSYGGIWISLQSVIHWFEKAQKTQWGEIVQFSLVYWNTFTAFAQMIGILFYCWVMLPPPPAYWTWLFRDFSLCSHEKGYWNCTFHCEHWSTANIVPRSGSHILWEREGKSMMGIVAYS